MIAQDRISYLFEMAERGFALGLRFTPLKGKIPIREGWQSEPVADVGAVCDWIDAQFNLGVRCGICSAPPGKYLVVIDCDPGADIEALNLPRTVTVETGREGGRHFYYYSDVEVGNSSGRLGEHVDVRGQGGQVVYPGSLHLDTKRVYRFAEGLGLNDVVIADLPDALMARLSGPRLEPTHREGVMPLLSRTVDGQREAGRTTSYGQRALREECEKIANTPCGGRDNQINLSSFKLGGLVAGGELDRHEAELEIMAAGRAAGQSDREIIRAMKSGLDAGAEHPRSPETEMSDAPHRIGAVENAGEPWGALEPLNRRWLEPMQSVPFEGPLAEMIYATARHTETPIEVSLSYALAVAAGSIRGRYEICVEPEYKEHLALWCAAVQPSGTRKTAIYKALVEPMVRYEMDQKQETDESVRLQELERENIEARIKILRKKSSGLDDLNARKEACEQIVRLEGELAPEVHPPRLWVDDVTSEQLAVLMSRNQQRMLMLSDEGGSFDNLAGRYSNCICNLDIYLKAHCGSPVRVDRGSRPEVMMNNPLLSIGISFQPSVLAHILGNSDFKGRGLLARFMFFLPEPTIGHRELRPYEIPDHIRESYAGIIRKLLDTPATEQSASLYLNEDSYKIWKDFQRWVETQLTPGGGGKLENLTDWGGKLPGLCARLAGVLHCVRYPEAPGRIPIDNSTMLSAAVLSEIAMDHAIHAFFGMGGADPETEAARKVIGWLERHGKLTFSQRECWRDNCRGLDQEIFRKGLQLLVEHQFIRVVPSDKRSGPGRKSSSTFEVNPALFKE